MLGGGGMLLAPLTQLGLLFLLSEGAVATLASKSSWARDFSQASLVTAGLKGLGQGRGGGRDGSGINLMPGSGWASEMLCFGFSSNLRATTL